MAAQCRSFFDDVKKELECCVCQEQFDEVNEPKILKCLHTFCKSCLERWLRQQGGSRLSCPTCRQITECPNNNINSLPSNLFYKQMVGIVEAYRGKGREDSPHCGNCEQRRSLKFYCSDCNCFLCEECSMAHKKLKVLSGHHVKEIGNFVSSDAQDYARKLNVCEEHKDQVRFYCEPCVTCICRDCAILEHRDHNFVSIDKGLERKRSEIETKMGNVLANGSRLRDEKEFLKAQEIRMNKSIERAKQEVHRVAERNIALIRQHESSVTEELIKQKDFFEAEFSNAVFRMDERLTEIESGLEFCNDILRRNNLAEILNVKEILEERFQELSKPSDVNMKPNCCEVKYVPNDLFSLKESTGKLLTTKTVPSLSEAEGAGLTEGTQGEDCVFTVVTKDSWGDKTHSEIDRVTVDIRSLQTGTALQANITDSNNGCYTVSYKPQTAGDFNVSLYVADEPIKGNPFQLKVKEKIRKSEDYQPFGLIEEGKNCYVCFYAAVDPLFQLQCGHYMCCKGCKEKLLGECDMYCYICRRKVLFLGNQPTGHMTFRKDSGPSLPGYETFETIVLGFNFDRGIQGEEHPNCGVPYLGLFCSAYLPGNKEGQKLCELLRRAFDARLLFTIGTDNTIVFNDIELKTSRSGGPAKRGYPDAEYLDRLKNQLALKGVK